MDDKIILFLFRHIKMASSMSIYVPSIKKAQTRNFRQLTVSVHRLKKQDTRVVFIVQSIQNAHKGK